MPNLNAPKGLVPTRHLDGSPWNAQFTKVFVSSSDATAIFIGDIVKYIGSSPAAGTVAFGEDVSGVPMVARVTASNDATATWAGVVAGFKVNPDNLMQKHRVASQSRIGYIINDPTVVYECQEDALVTPIAAASIGLNAQLVFTAGSAVTGVSGLVIDSDTVTTAAAANVKILGLVKRLDNEFNSGGAGTDQAKFEVTIQHPLATVAGVAGV